MYEIHGLKSSLFKDVPSFIYILTEDNKQKFNDAQ